MENLQSNIAAKSDQSESFDIAIIGAGFAGMYMLYKARALGLRAIVFDTAGGVGGTWYWNRYPGARCDVESMQYSYSFSEEIQQKWHWKERFSPQPEILAYANFVANELDLHQDIQFNTRIVSAHYAAERHGWTLTTDNGQQIASHYCVMATGCLSAPLTPDIPGLKEFSGEVFHTGNWPHDGVDLTGQKAGVIGTGSSGIQVIPELAKQASHLFVFQRTPNFTIPARNCPMTAEYEAKWKKHYAERRLSARQKPSGILPGPSALAASDVSAADLEAEFEKRWAHGRTDFTSAYSDLLVDVASNEAAASFVREKIRETVADQNAAESLIPRDYPIGAKRICA